MDGCRSSAKSPLAQAISQSLKYPHNFPPLQLVRPTGRYIRFLILWVTTQLSVPDKKFLQFLPYSLEWKVKTPAAFQQSGTEADVGTIPALICKRLPASLLDSEDFPA